MSTPMQPVYLTGHSRPVNQVKHNYDGDLLFTCSDDGTVCMYETLQLVRTGVFKINEACRSIDLTKDSKYMIAAATTVGVQIYDIKTGERKVSVQVPGVNAKMVSLSFGDKMVMCLYEFEKRSYIRIFDMQECFAGNTPKVEYEIQAGQDIVFTKAVWGPKNETIIISTTNGKLF
jgi:translation initiation factor 3 subunit I